MSFPTTWLQAWLNMEFPSNPADPFSPKFYKASCFWYGLISGSCPTDPTELQDLAENTSALLINSYSLADLPMNNSFTNVYVRSPGVSYDRKCVGPFGTNDWSDRLPYTVAITMNRITAHPGRRGSGRLFISGLKDIDVDGDHLTDVAMGDYGVLGEFLLNDTFSATSDWSPFLESYTRSSFEDITAIFPSQKTATIRKRRNPHNYRNPIVNGPKQPPT